VTPALAAVLGYMAVQLAIGIWISRRIATESDYLVGGRRLGHALATVSIFATWFGAETMVGSAGIAYRDGASLASAEPFGYGLCLVLMGLVFAVPLRRRGLTTLADLYRERYSPMAERLAALILVPGSILWAAAQIRGFGHILATASAGLDVAAAIRVAAFFTILYTMFGGLLADAINDLIQGVTLVLGLVVLLTVVIVSQGGIEPMVSSIPSTRVELLPGTARNPLDLMEEWAIPVFGSVLATELVGRVLATRDLAVARRAPIVAGVLYLVVGLIPVVIGMVGPSVAPGLTDGEQLLPVVARTLLPTFGFAIFAGALIAAILSTVDSTLLTASALVSHNLLVPALGIERERAKVLIARAGVAVFGVVAYTLALRAEGVFALVEQASAFGSAGVVVTVVFGLFTTIGGPKAAMSTLVAGVVTYLVASYGGAATPFLLSLAVSLLTYVAVGFAERGTWEQGTGNRD
jgi:solute:Na+ symporter, SSS family